MTESNPSAPEERAITKIDPPGHGLPDRAFEVSEHPEADAPGVLIFGREGHIVSATANVDRYLRELGARDSRMPRGPMRQPPAPVSGLLSWRRCRRMPFGSWQ